MYRPHADVVEGTLSGAYAVLEDAVADDQFAVVAVDAVDFGGIEEVGEEHVDDRHDDESDQDLAEQAVGAQPEGGGCGLVQQRLGRIGEALDVGFPDKTVHLQKTALFRAKLAYFV